MLVSPIQSVGLDVFPGITSHVFGRTTPIQACVRRPADYRPYLDILPVSEMLIWPVKGVYVDHYQCRVSMRANCPPKGWWGKSHDPLKHLLELGQFCKRLQAAELFGSTIADTTLLTRNAVSSSLKVRRDLELHIS